LRSRWLTHAPLDASGFTSISMKSFDRFIWMLRVQANKACDSLTAYEL
jgi:hypothetical protein